MRSESNGCGSEAGAGGGADGYYVRNARRHDQARPFRYGAELLFHLTCCNGVTCVCVCGFISGISLCYCLP